MSDVWIHIIPESPDYVPDEDAVRRAIELLRQFTPRAETITADTSPRRRFIDCGENFERVLCPSCGHYVAIDEWADWMDREQKADFPLAPHALPCCAAERSLADLIYDWPQGFARFSLGTRNPDITELSDHQLAQLGATLGCRVQSVLQRI